ncbi:MAG: hypothetical protein WD490_09670 [Opitutales bacterium]
MNKNKTAQSQNTNKGRRGHFLWPLLIGVGVLGLGGLAVGWLRSEGSTAYAGPTGTAQRGDLTISVTESGSLRNRDQVIVTNRVEGRTAILWIIDEGREVEEGDLLVELDSSEREDELVESRIELQNAEADFIRAREQLAVTKNQNESDIAEAELTLRLAKLDLARYLGQQDMMDDFGLTLTLPAEAQTVPAALETEAPPEGAGPAESQGAAEGDYAQQRERLLSEIELAREELARAEQQWEDSKQLAERGFVTELEVEGDRLAMERGKVDVKLAEGQLHLLENYTHRRDMEQFQSDVIQAERALERVKLTANSNLVQAQADYDSAEQEVDEERREYEDDKLQLEYCKIYAPAAGMVVYETSANQDRRGNNEPLQAGIEVRERQELIYLPSSEGMIADVTVHESSLDRIAIGMPAIVRVDARRGSVFEGAVRRIAPMPDAQSIWLNPDLTVYETQIEVNAGSRELRTGMSCQVEIIVDELVDIVYVPLESVTRYGDRHYVYVTTPQGPQARRVEIGMDNNRVVHIKEGIEAGEIVLLAPPIHDRMEEEEPGDLPPGPDGSSPSPQAPEEITASPGKASSEPV